MLRMFVFISPERGLVCLWKKTARYFEDGGQPLMLLSLARTWDQWDHGIQKGSSCVQLSFFCWVFFLNVETWDGRFFFLLGGGSFFFVWHWDVFVFCWGVFLIEGVFFFVEVDFFNRRGEKSLRMLRGDFTSNGGNIVLWGCWEGFYIEGVIFLTWGGCYMFYIETFFAEGRLFTSFYIVIIVWGGELFFVKGWLLFDCRFFFAEGWSFKWRG